MGPEDNPKDEEKPTKEEWDAYLEADPALADIAADEGLVDLGGGPK